LAKLVTKMVVVSALDDNYVFPFLIMIYSAKKNAEEDFSLIIGFDDKTLSKENQLFISKCCLIFDISHKFMEIKIDSSLPSSEHITATAYGRLYLADIVEGEALWLDSDLICLSNWQTIKQHMNRELNNDVIQAVIDQGILKGVNIAADNLAILKAEGRYFNTGVLIFNFDNWRKVQLNEKWKPVAAKYSEYKFDYADQCVLNYLCCDIYSEIPEKYNRLALLRKTSKDRYILHFAGGVKPWTYRKFELAKYFGTLLPADIDLYLRYEQEAINFVARANRELSIELSRKKNRLLVGRKRSNVVKNKTLFLRNLLSLNPIRSN